MPLLSDNLKKFSFIPAKPSHYRPLVDFLVDIRGSEDHIRFLLDGLLKAVDDPKVIHSNIMALLRGKIIALSCRIFFPGHYSWGCGLTVDPRFRKLGLARRLIEIGEGIARENNISQMRAALIKDNIPIFKKLGFSEAGLCWYILGCKLNQFKAIDSKSLGVREAVASDFERLEKFLSNSGYFVLSKQMYAEDLNWYPLDHSWLGDLIKQGKVLLNEDDSGIRGLAIINKKSLINPFSDNSFSIMEAGYLDGDSAVILDFIRENYHPDFLRIYSADKIPPVRTEEKCVLKFNDLFGGLKRLDFSEGKLFSTSVTLMQKIIQ